MVDGKSTSAKSGLEFTTPRFPALQAHVPSLSPPPAPWKYHGAEASAPSQYCVSTSLGEPQPPATKTREHASHEALTQLKALLSRAPCTTLITPLPSSPAKFAFTKLLSEGKGSEHLPHANSSTKGGSELRPHWRWPPPGTEAPSLLCKWLGPREHCRRNEDHLLPTPHSSGSLQQ